MTGYIITDRRTGLGDSLLNLCACWYLAKRYKRQVIIDWRRLPYNLKETENWTRHEVNLFHSLFSCPPKMQGVHFLFPENFDKISFGPKTKDGYPFDLDHLPLISQEASSFASVDGVLKNNKARFVRCDMRMGQKNACFSRLKTINSSNFNYWFFINSLPLCIPVKDRLHNVKKGINNNTVGIHFRHGNGETWWMGGKPRFKNIEESAEGIVRSVKKNLGDDLSKFNFRIFSDSADARARLKDLLPNSQQSSSTLPPAGEGALHFDTNSHPIASIQDSLIDMLHLAACPYLFYTEHSTFSIAGLHNTAPERTHKLFG